MILFLCSLKNVGGIRMKKQEKETIYIYRGFVPWRSQLYVPEKEAEHIIVIKNIGKDYIKSSFQTHGTKTKALKEAIKYIMESGSIKNKKISFLPIESNRTIYADGYFGRPRIPAEYWIIKKLSYKQLKFAKKYLASLLKKEG
jgi:hypothetical protein